jgi:nucleoside-diphosphate-sugar epimerase
MSNIIANKKVAITGGAGFIGANLIHKLLSLNYEINLLVRSSTNLWRLKEILPKLKIHEIDISDKQNLKEILTIINPKAIIHLATYTQYRNQQDFEQMIETNIRGTLNLLSASKDIDYDIFINTGSSSEYGIKNNPMRETDLLEPVSFYAATKSSATLLCQVFSREYRKPIVILRPFSAYGPYEEENRFIPTIIKSVIEDRPIKLTPGDERRDFIYIDDIVNVYLKAIQKGKSLAGQILNMGTGKEYTNDEVVKTLFKMTGKKVPIEKGAYPARIWDTLHWVADTSKTKQLLNWEPKFTLEEGLRQTYLWFNK